MIYLYVKGNAEQALQAVNDHGIHESDRPVGPFVIQPFKGRPEYLVSEFFVKDECAPGVERWWQETEARLQYDQQFPPVSWPAGTLLIK